MFLTKTYKLYSFSVFNNEKSMKIIENFETNEFYIWKRNGKHSKLELVRRNYVFCRNEKNMLLSPTEHAEVNSFCEVKRSLIFCPMICPGMDHPVYIDVGEIVMLAR